MKVGDILKRKNGDAYKVLAIRGDFYALYFVNDHEGFWTWYTKQELEKYFDLPKEIYKPKQGETYSYIGTFGEVNDSTWSDDYTDNSRYNAGNCYKTQQEALVAAERVKKAYL